MGTGAEPSPPQRPLLFFRTGWGRGEIISAWSLGRNEMKARGNMGRKEEREGSPVVLHALLLFILHVFRLSRPPPLKEPLRRREGVEPLIGCDNDALFFAAWEECERRLTRLAVFLHCLPQCQGNSMAVISNLNIYLPSQPTSFLHNVWFVPRWSTCDCIHRVVSSDYNIFSINHG